MSWGVYEITSSEGGVRLINGIARTGMACLVEPDSHTIDALGLEN